MDNDQNASFAKSNLKADKVLGYLLLSIGLIFILWTVFSIYGVLTGKTKPAQVFNVQAPEITLPSVGSQATLPEGLQLPGGISLNTSDQNPTKVKIIPDEVFNGLLNIGIYYLLMMFIASSGAKISSIGIQLVKDIKVEIKEDKIKSQL